MSSPTQAQQASYSQQQLSPAQQHRTSVLGLQHAAAMGAAAPLLKGKRGVDGEVAALHHAQVIHSSPRSTAVRHCTMAESDTARLIHIVWAEASTGIFNVLLHNSVDMLLVKHHRCVGSAAHHWAWSDAA